MLLRVFNLGGNTAGAKERPDTRSGGTWSGLGLTCRVWRNIQDGLQKLHVFNVVNVNGLLQANEQPLKSHRPINLSGLIPRKGPDHPEITPLSCES